MIFFSKVIDLFLALFLHEGFIQLQQAGATLWLWRMGFILQWLLFLQSMALESGFSSYSSCGARAQLLCGMWDLPGPGIKVVSCPLHWQVDSEPVDHQGSPQSTLKKYIYVYLLDCIQSQLRYMVSLLKNLSLQCIDSQEGSMGLHESSMACGILIP